MQISRSAARISSPKSRAQPTITFRGKRWCRWLVFSLLLALVFRAGLALAPRAYLPTITTTANAIVPPLDLRLLAEIAPDGDPRDVARYCQQTDVKAVFSDFERAPAYCAMYLTHVAKPYGEAPEIDTLAQFLALEYADCGAYAQAELQIMRALGIPSRLRVSDSHAWVEVLIDGTFETFDATTNVWLGADNTYRMFYTPAADPAAPYVFRANLNADLNVLQLRMNEPFNPP